MKVVLKQDWFGPEAKRYRVRDNPHEMDEGLLPFLPSSAKVLAEEKPAEEAPKAPPAKIKI